MAESTELVAPTTCYPEGVPDGFPVDLFAPVDGSELVIREAKLRKKIDDLQRDLGEYPQTEIAVTNTFSGGVYAREIFIPKGTTVIGKVHRLGMSQDGRAVIAKPAPDMRKRVFKAPKVRRTHVKPPKPGPQKKGAVQHGKGCDFSDNPEMAEARRAQYRSQGMTSLERVESGAGVESPFARPWMENRKPDECNWTIGPRYAIKACCNPVKARGWCAGHYAVGIDQDQPRPLYAADARAYARHERTDRAKPANDGTVWDEARAAA
jgi:hypothetical protein